MPNVRVFGLQLLSVKRLCGLMAGSGLIPLWWLIGNELGEFDIWYVLFAHAVLAIAVASQCVVVYAVWRLFRKMACSGTVVIVFAWICMLLNLNAFGLATLNMPQAMTLTMSGLVAAIAIFSVVISPRGLVFVSRFGVLLVLVAFGSSLSQEISKQFSDPKSQQAFLAGVGSPKRNLYLVSFDALVSLDAYKDIYQKKTPPPWFAYFRDKGFEIVPNALSPADRTLESFGTIFNFGESGNMASMVGRTYNPVYEVFKKSGYQTAFLNETNYFGYARGSLLDYLYPGKLASKTCNFAPEQFLFGACRLFQHKVPGGDGPLTQALLDDFNHFMAKRSEQTPWLTVVYVWYPGHSPMENSYQYDDSTQTAKWSQKFTGKVEASVAVIDQVVGVILKKDPNSVIAVFGDHGSINFRGVELPGSPKVPVDQVLLDGLGVSLAVYPSGACPGRFADRYEVKHIVKDLLQCGALNL